MKKILILFGTRPEVIKLAPVAIELQRKGVETFLCNTEQQKELSNQTLFFFNLASDVNLDVMRINQDLSSLAGILIQKLSELFDKEDFAATIVQGDTMSAFCGAFVSFLKKVPVIHVEAGLRTGILTEPFPEEALRQMISRISAFNMAPTSKAVVSLLNEAVNKESVFLTGNTVIDALHKTVTDDFKFDDEKLANIDYENKRIILVTTHRRENLGEPMRHVYKALKDIVNEFDDVEIVFPVHKNPKVREVVNEELGNIKAVHLIDPLDYEPFANLMHRAFLVLTDSGGIQEEAPSLGKPVLVLRDTTERPEAVKAGTVKLIGTERQKVYEETKYLLTDHDEYQRMANTCNPYGDGKASKRIIEAILYHYGLSQEKPDSFIAGK